jgi:hypothetical protein
MKTARKLRPDSTLTVYLKRSGEAEWNIRVICPEARKPIKGSGSAELVLTAEPFLILNPNKKRKRR